MEIGGQIVPLRVTVEIISNDEQRSSHIQTLYIARLDALGNFEQTSNYVVGESMAELAANDSDIAFFTHKYSDGAEACVLKAIEAREKAGLPT